MKQILYLVLLTALFSCTGTEALVNSSALRGFDGTPSELPSLGWSKKPIFYSEHELNQAYKKVAKIHVTTGQYTSQKGLIRKIKREAGKYEADAILITKSYTTSRTYHDGFAATANFLSIFSESDCCCEEEPLETSGAYRATKVEAWAIRYKN